MVIPSKLIPGTGGVFGNGSGGDDRSVAGCGLLCAVFKILAVDLPGLPVDGSHLGFNRYLDISGFLEKRRVPDNACEGCRAAVHGY